MWILMPWAVFGTAPLFSKMADFAPELAWGAWAFTCGLFIICGVLNGLYKLLSNALAFAIWHWGTVSIMMWWGDWHNTGGVTYSFVAIFCIYSWLNIRVNHVMRGNKQGSFNGK
jgi:hypothetical protein